MNSSHAIVSCVDCNHSWIISNKGTHLMMVSASYSARACQISGEYTLTLFSGEEIECMFTDDIVRSELVKDLNEMHAYEYNCEICGGEIRSADEAAPVSRRVMCDFCYTLRNPVNCCNCSKPMELVDMDPGMGKMWICEDCEIEYIHLGNCNAFDSGGFRKYA
jgi:DNA-directed RNA polymerase subunit RPC12/RpoP